MIVVFYYVGLSSERWAEMLRQYPGEEILR